MAFIFGYFYIPFFFPRGKKVESLFSSRALLLVCNRWGGHSAINQAASSTTHPREMHAYRKDDVHLIAVGGPYRHVARPCIHVDALKDPGILVRRKRNI